MKKEIFIWTGMFTLIACRLLAAAPDGDWFKIISVTPTNGTVFVPGATARVTIGYRLATSDSAQISAKGIMGTVITCCVDDPPQATVAKGTGTVDLLLGASKITTINKIRACIWITADYSLSDSYDISLRWTEPAYVNVPLDPQFRSVTDIDIDSHFPCASDLCDDLLHQGVVSARLRDNVRATRWEISLGKAVAAAAAQDILNRCLACTSGITRVELTPEDEPYIAGWVTISPADESAPVMPRSLLANLLKPGLTTAQFQDLIMGWNHRIPGTGPSFP